MRKFLGLLFAVMIFASCASVKKTDYQMPIQVSLIKEIKSNNAFRMLLLPKPININRIKTIFRRIS